MLKNKKNLTIEKVYKEMCTGCGACQNICAVHAIEMKENYEGFKYPVIQKAIVLIAESV